MKAYISPSVRGTHARCDGLARFKVGDVACDLVIRPPLELDACTDDVEEVDGIG
jgi:hypothetical protein